MELLLALFVIAIIAGWVDSIGGGGGLICIPALLWAGFPHTRQLKPLTRFLSC